MARVLLSGLVLGLLLAGAPALAFEEVSGGGAASEATAQAPAAPPPASGGIDSLDLSTGDGSADAGAGGTEVKIPGLGSIGVLPKLDFGLELLYGATNDGGAPSAPETDVPADGDLTVKGEIKHTF